MWRKFAKALVWVYLAVGVILGLGLAFSVGGSLGSIRGYEGAGFVAGLVTFLIAMLGVFIALCNFGMRVEQAENVEKIRDELFKVKDSLQRINEELVKQGHRAVSNPPYGSGSKPGNYKEPVSHKDDWVCSKCGRVNSEQTKQCASCGTKRIF